MPKEYRIMFLSEKSGRNYSVKLSPVRLALLLLTVVALCCVAVVSLVLSVGALRGQGDALARVERLQREVAQLQDRERESALYKQWADKLIFRRMNPGDGVTAAAPEQDPAARTGQIAGVARNAAGSTLDIDDFDVRRINLALDFEVSFKLINRKRGAGRQDGYLFIVASNREVQPERYTAWPAVALAGDVPVDYTRGSRFSIHYLKEVTGRITQPDIGARFNRVDIVAYAGDGTLIMKRGYYIERQLQQHATE